MISLKTIVLAAACSLLTCNVAVAQNHNDFANYKRYAEENAKLGKPAKGEKRVVFMGNSITEGWVNTHPDFFKKHGYIGRGISGQTSYQFLLRFREDVINLEPKVLVLNYGTNDIAENTGPYNEDITFGNILSMVELAQAHKIKVILTSTLPARNFGWRPSVTDAMEKIRSLNARVKAYAEENGIQYVDYFTALLAPDKGGMDTKYTPETVHPNGAGYDVMEALIVPAIEKAL
jgi:lysophospholipase L1-like esterase